MDKLFVNVEDAASVSYYIEHFTGDSDDHSMDDKIAFLHTESQIATKHRIFGGKKVTVNPQANSFVDKNGNVITLNISENAELSFDMYTASSFGTCSINGKGTSGASGSKTVAYGSTINTSITAYTGNQTSYNINHGTTNIILTGVKVGYNSTYAYVYGGETTIEDNIVTYIDNIGYVTEANYVNSNISGTCVIPSELKSSKTTVIASDYITGTLSGTASATQQYAYFYYHELGKDNIYSTIKTCDSSISLTYNITYSYYYGTTPVAQETLQSLLNGTKSTIPSPVTIDSTDVEGRNIYAYIGVLKKFGKAGVTETGSMSQPMAFEFADNPSFISAGGWLFVQYLTLYSANDFAIYRSAEHNLGNKTWYIRAKE